MKKLTLKIAFVAAFAAIAGYNVYQSQQVEQISDLALANIEALASGEGNFDGNPCAGSVEQKCCVCGNTHYTWAVSTGGGCETKKCTHHSY